MGAMYKEIIFRKRLPVIIVFFFAMIVLISILKIIEVMDIVPLHLSREVDIICLFSLLLFGGYEIQKCRVQYKYSIIGDELIIHKLKGEEQILVEDIKIEDIQYIGCISRSYNKKKNVKTKKYICSILNINKYCCIYSEGNKNYKMYFEPSRDLINKVKSIKDKQHRFCHKADNFNLGAGSTNVCKL